MRPKWESFSWGPWPATEQTPGEDGARRRSPDPSTHRHGTTPAGEPESDDDRPDAGWYRARRAAMDHVLAAIAGSAWADHLVLRGSVLLKAWYGDAAREPDDLDFVVVPSSWRMRERRTAHLLEGIARAAERLSRSGDEVRIGANGAVTEDLWNDGRAPGRRLVLPWQAGPRLRGTVRLDLVFEQTLPAAPELTTMPRLDGGEAAPLNAATPELSLAWKILWLLTDARPQGKDLYDAVLLAESTSVSGPLLRQVLVEDDGYYAHCELTPAALTGLDVDWAEFRREYPHVPGPGHPYAQRLATALARTLAEPAMRGPAEPLLFGCARSRRAGDSLKSNG